MLVALTVVSVAAGGEVVFFVLVGVWSAVWWGLVALGLGLVGGGLFWCQHH